MFYFFEPLKIFFSPQHLNAELLRLILNFLTVFRIERNHQHLSFYLKNTICDLFVYCQSYVLLLSKHFVGCLHHREAGNRENLMPSCLALIHLEMVVDLGTWKMERTITIVKEKIGCINTNFWKISLPISMMYVNHWPHYPTPLIKNSFPLHHLLIMHPFLLVFGRAVSLSHLLMNIL